MVRYIHNPSHSLNRVMLVTAALTRIIRATNRRINENPRQHIRRTLFFRFSGGCR